MITIDEFITKYDLSMTVRLITKRPDNLMNDMSQGSTHWECRLDCGASHASIVVYFSMGPAYKRHPKIDEVLNALAGDAQDSEISPSDFAAEFGYSDPRQAQKVWDACTKNRQKLLDLLGNEAVDELIYETEQL